MKEGRKNKIFGSKSKTFLAFCFCFILGVGIFSSLEWEKYWQYRLFVAVFIGGVLLVWLWQKIMWRFIILCVLFFIFGGLRFMLSVPDISPENIAYYNGANKIVSGKIVGEPDARIDASRYVLSTDKGKILFKLPLFPEYHSGDTLKINCNLQTPKNSLDSNFRYDNYLARQGIFSICVGPKILSQTSGGGRRIFLGLKNIINERVEKLWPEPESSLVAGLLYGARGGFSADLLDDFSRVGITHIIAISGYNISIIAVVLMSGLIGIGFYRRQAFWICVVGIVVFVLFTGASASVVRAGIMGIIVLLAQQLGRLSRIGNALALTAALMLLANPYILIWDAGFQLSFLATVGLVYLSPLVEKFIPKFIRLEMIRETLVSTFSAIIITLPLILYQFGRLSLVAPLANVLVLWIIPWLMLFGFLSLIISFVFMPVAQVSAWITGLGLKYVIFIAQWFGGQSWSAVNFSIPLSFVIVGYVFLGFLVYKNNKDCRPSEFRVQ